MTKVEQLNYDNAKLRELLEELRTETAIKRSQLERADLMEVAIIAQLSTNIEVLHELKLQEVR